jgi:glycosyltransferase involved in cell wall biosynthesis
MTIDITIPVLNEEATLATQVAQLLKFLEEKFHGTSNWQVVIADNGSTDTTAAIARRLAEESSRVRFVQVPERGVGLALKTSWGASTADIVGYMDLDLATDLKHFPTAYEAIAHQGYDLVYGTRLHPKIKGHRSNPETRNQLARF